MKTVIKKEFRYKHLIDDGSGPYVVASYKSKVRTQYTYKYNNRFYRVYAWTHSVPPMLYIIVKGEKLFFPWNQKDYKK